MDSGELMNKNSSSPNLTRVLKIMCKKLLKDLASLIKKLELKVMLPTIPS